MTVMVDIPSASADSVDIVFAPSLRWVDAADNEAKILVKWLFLSLLAGLSSLRLLRTRLVHDHAC